MNEERNLLRVSALGAGYVANVNVLHDIDLIIDAGEVVALLGRNGAGKSTLIRCISGMLAPFTGSITFKGRDIAAAPAQEIVKLGIAVVPEGRRVFGSLTVEENLVLGMYARRTGIFVKADLSHIFERFPRLAERRSQQAGTLSGGEQQMLAIGRALMTKPNMLLLDEPSMGLAPMFIESVFDIINELARSGVTILLVEQNATAALDIADRAYVLERGRIVQSGDAEQLQQQLEIRAHYLGV